MRIEKSWLLGAGRRRESFVFHQWWVAVDFNYWKFKPRRKKLKHVAQAGKVSTLLQRIQWLQLGYRPRRGQEKH